jgi:transcriptional regulator with XRE-family HTH domain
MPRLKPNDIDKQIGSNIRLLRSRKGMSQSDLGAAIGVSFQQVQKYEDGRSPVAASRLLLVVSALDQSLQEIIDLTFSSN